MQKMPITFSRTDHGLFSQVTKTHKEAQYGGRVIRCRQK